MFRRLTALWILCVILSGCRNQTPTEKFSAQIFAMDTVMDLMIYSEDDRALQEGAELVQKLEKAFSATDDSSEIYALNHTGSCELSTYTAELFGRGLEVCRLTEGALDLSVYPIVRAWGFTEDAYRIPSDQVLQELLTHVDYRKIHLDGDEVSIPEGMEVDLGSIAKGYTGDQLVKLFKSHGIASALLNLGGNVQALGAKPDGTNWKVGIQNPLGEGYLGVLSIQDQAVITSGGYERFFEGSDGQIYWHIMDPKTGYPAKNGVISATAIGKEGTYCDALSTSLFIMGLEKAQDFWREQGDFQMILVTDQNEVWITPGLIDAFSLTEDTIYQLKVIADD